MIQTSPVKECTFCIVSSLKAGNYTVKYTPSQVMSDRYFVACHDMIRFHTRLIKDCCINEYAALQNDQSSLRKNNFSGHCSKRNALKSLSSTVMTDCYFVYLKKKIKCHVAGQCNNRIGKYHSSEWIRAGNNGWLSLWRRDFSEYFQPKKLKYSEKSLLYSDDRLLFPLKALLL